MSLYLSLQQKIASVGAEGNPRCTWDKNALLYLRRTLTETGETIEYVVPQDSIVRNADGTWGAHMVVEADRACVHYQYSVRIDQTNSMVKVINPDRLLPKTINGPDLFYNEVASIARFHATDGDDRYSVLLNWEPTPGGLDVYELRRREAGSTAAFDSITTTTETDYRDSDVEPGKPYEYQAHGTLYLQQHHDHQHGYCYRKPLALRTYLRTYPLCRRYGMPGRESDPDGHWSDRRTDHRDGRAGYIRLRQPALWCWQDLHHRTYLDHGRLPIQQHHIYDGLCRPKRRQPRSRCYTV